MNKTIEYLNPAKKLVDETVDWLCGNDKYAAKIRTLPEKVNSLEHIMVIVPTAQSGRNLRRQLAKKCQGGIMPPQIAIAGNLLQDPSIATATAAEELAIMAKVLRDENLDLNAFQNVFPRPPQTRTLEWALAIARQILEIYEIIGERALNIADVNREIGAQLPENPARWQELAKIEQLFLVEFKNHNVLPRHEVRRLIVKRGCINNDIETIVLPSLVDLSGALEAYLKNSSQNICILVQGAGEKFDEWGRPTVEFAADIEPNCIISAPNALVEAEDIAEYFCNVKDNEALPALAVCDTNMFPELEGAFQTRFSEDKLKLRNPSKTALIKSSLGRLLDALIQLAESKDYSLFSTLVRTGDIARWAANLLDRKTSEIAQYIGVLDSVQNRHLPQTIDAVIEDAKTDVAFTKNPEKKLAYLGLAQLAEIIRDELQEPFNFLSKIYASLILDEQNSGDRELIAAAKIVRELREQCNSKLIPNDCRRYIFREMLKNATYMLEPTAPNILSTTGWLEIQWCLEDELVLAGFNEGCVPENLVGHAFLPDSLRHQLNLMTNNRRALRDSYILTQACACRAKNCIRIYLHQITSSGDVVKPSRLLFLGISDDDLPELARRLYAVTPGSRGAPFKELPQAWRLKLPIPPTEKTYRKNISVTKLDEYYHQPLRFFLKEIFGEKVDDNQQELDAKTFGSMCHEALDRFAKSEFKDSIDEREIAEFLEKEIRKILKNYGSNLPAVIELQGEAAITRLKSFARIQAERRRNGWRIIASEQNLKCTIKPCPTVINGKIDRIDCHETSGELAIIDYKTWRKDDDDKKDSIQLPLYRALIETSGKYGEQAKHAKAFYCILTEVGENVQFDEQNAYDEGTQSENEKQILDLLERIATGIFYSEEKKKNDISKTDYTRLIWENIEEGLDAAWLKDQEYRLQQFTATKDNQ